MPHLSFFSPVGDLTVIEEDGALVALEWGRAPEGARSKLLMEAQRQLDAYFARRLKAFDLPLRMIGTEFQKRVWARMVKIPYGETVSYGLVARELASGPRAVGTACGRNPVPIIVPCHRILATNGIGGFSGGTGLDTKRALLRLEGSNDLL
jgi:methylated-DNA-[protein]-cysteine S-methyltransferase